MHRSHVVPRYIYYLALLIIYISNKSAKSVLFLLDRIHVGINEGALLPSDYVGRNKAWSSTLFGVGNDSTEETALAFNRVTDSSIITAFAICNDQVGIAQNHKISKTCPERPPGSKTFYLRDKYQTKPRSKR